MLIAPDISLTLINDVCAGHGISQVTCGMEVESPKKPYIVYRGEYTLIYYINKNSLMFSILGFLGNIPTYQGVSCSRFTHRRPPCRYLLVLFKAPVVTVNSWLIFIYVLKD